MTSAPVASPRSHSRSALDRSGSISYQRDMNRLAVAGRGALAEPVSRRRKWLALAVAALADAIQTGLFPAFIEGAISPADDGLDAVTAVLLLIILGFRWRLAFALATELIPGVDLFPTWTAVVVSVPAELKKELPPKGA